MRFVLFYLFIGSCVFAAEVDQFSKYNESISDSLLNMNRELNENFEQAIIKANSKSSCDEKVLHKEMKVYFSNHFSGGKYLEYLHHSPEIDRKVVTRGDSIYRDWRFFNGVVLRLGSDDNSELSIVPMVKVGGIEVGIDKIEHFFGSGHGFYEKLYIDGKSLDKVFKNNIFRERNLLGARWTGSGVFSFGDISANFTGIRFWNAVLKKHPDLLGQDLGPYVICEGEKFRKVEDVNLADYVDDSFNETVNCSMLSSKNGTKKVLNRISEISSSYKCPMVPAKLDRLIKKYGDLGKYLLNKQGIMRVPFGNSFDNYGLQTSREEAKAKPKRKKRRIFGRKR